MIWSGSAYRELQREVREASTTAVTALTEGRSHQANCVEHNQRIEAMLREGRTVNEQRHCENQDAISAVHGRVTNLTRMMLLLVIGAGGTFIVALLGAVYAIFSHKLGLS